jgi:hypothetical protein
LLAQKFDSCWISYPDIELIDGKYYLYYGYWFPNWPDEKKSIFRREILSGAPAIPTVSAFTIPASSSSLAVSITTFAATDDGDIGGYRITESVTPPLVDDIVWSVIPPTSYTASSAGTKTLYAWVKDDAGHVSQSFSAVATVTPALSSEKVITAFTIPNQTGTTTINEGTHTISVTMPIGTNVTALIPAITITGASINPNTSVAQNFTSPVNYTVTAADASTQVYVVTVTVTPEEEFFKNLKLDFNSEDVRDKKTSKKEVALKFKNISGIKYYKISTQSNLAKAKWKKIEKEIDIEIDQQERDEQQFFLKFKDENGEITKTYKKEVTFEPVAYSIFNFPNRGRKGDVMTQSGDKFSPNSKVALYFSGFWGGYYAPIYVNTDEKGNFSLDYKITKMFGWYHWYAVDIKTNTKTKTTSYLVF